MQLTKFTHACVRLDDGDRTLVLDPGAFSEVDEALDGADAVLITHEHADHIDAEKLRAALQRDSRLRVWAPNSVTAQLEGFDEQVVVVGAGESFDAAGFPVRTFGGQHALIHSSIPVVQNVAMLVADTVYHPGDSFTVPSTPVPVFLLPTTAPWAKVGEIIDFAVAVRAPRTFQVHDSLGTPVNTQLVEGHLARTTEPFGVEFQHLDVRQTIDL